MNHVYVHTCIFLVVICFIICCMIEDDHIQKMSLCLNEGCNLLYQSAGAKMNASVRLDLSF